MDGHQTVATQFGGIITRGPIPENSLIVNLGCSHFQCTLVAILVRGFQQVDKLDI